MKRATLIRFAVLAVLVAAIGVAVYYRSALSTQALESWVQQFGAAGPLVFMAVYAIGTVLFLPGSVLTLAGGALFGPVWGTFYNLTGATLGAAIAFLIARYLASDWVHRKAGGWTKQLIEGVENEGWRFIAFVRLVPLFPFNLLNYALGLTRIRLVTYVVASYVFMLPGAIAYTYLGYLGREAAAGGQGLIQKGLLALALLSAVAFLPRLIAKLRKRPVPAVSPMLDVADLKRRLDAGEKIVVLDVRSAKDFSGELGHVAGATNIPLPELGARLAEIADHCKQPVVTICRTDRMSSSAAQLLAAQGFTDVTVVRQGMTDWNKRGFPVER